MVTPVAEDMDDANDAPVLQFVETVADVGAGDAKGDGNLLGWQRTGGKEKKSVDLGDGAIDTPTRAHFAPMKNEPLGHGREFFHVYLLFLSKQKLAKIDGCVNRKRVVSL